MAAAPHCYGLQIWLSGDQAFLLDSRGLVCVTDDWLQVLVLTRFESSAGPGSLRALLQVPVIDPGSAITLLGSRFKWTPISGPSGKGKAPPTPRRVLSPSAFQSLLESI